jgi:hypothetical protein
VNSIVRCREPDAHALKEPVVNGIGVGSCPACRTEYSEGTGSTASGGASEPPRAFRQMAGLARIWRRPFRTPKIPHFRGTSTR